MGVDKLLKVANFSSERERERANRYCSRPVEYVAPLNL